MKFSTKDLTKQLVPILDKARQYAIFGFVLLVMGLFGFLVFRINSLSRLEPDESAVTEKLQKIPRPRVDEEVVKKIENLRDQNVRVEALFDQARENPFAE